MVHPPKPSALLIWAVPVGGVALGLSLPPSNAEALAWFALAPLLVAARGRRPLEAVGLAILTGLAAGFAQVGWHRNLGAVYGALIPFFWLALLLSVVVTAATAAARRFSGWTWVLWTAALGVTVEWATSMLPLPMSLALTQHRDAMLLPIVAVTGAPGLAFLVWLTNAGLAESTRGRLSPRPLMVLAVVALAFTLIGERTSGALGRRVRVAVVQDHAPGDAEGVAPPESEGDPPDREALTRQAATSGVEVVVWSERCLGTAFRPDNPRDPTRSLARELRVALVPGYLSIGPGKPFNCAAWVDPDGQIRGVHHKLHPFMDETKTVQPGKEIRAHDTRLGRIGMEICFDTCFPEVTRALVRDGAALIAAPTIDPAEANAALHSLHAATLPLRAVENGAPLLRADPNGLSQVVDRDGRVRAIAPLWKPAAVVGDVRLGSGRGTLYTRWGDWLPVGCMLFCLGALAGRQRRETE
jgi:apolipoprotein N-acyltransferase